eukprot:TRINITY_DN67197_c2_g1_i1.p1 TRINITY_DN67197_c2_g1~~TRINITY_DN67197_c2_g1_i1.p1  ORF type:complete len:299 (-),score=15.38 TRINITY_DN67197_c2_g1_i1:65-961(-)
MCSNVFEEAGKLVESGFDLFFEQLSDLQQQVKDMKETLTEKRNKFRQDTKKLQTRIKDSAATAADSSSRVSLDIGGTLFNTTKETLLKSTDSFFSAMLSSSTWQPDQRTGAYFVDRSPNMFGFILEWLRTGKASAKGFSPLEVQMLEADVDFYCISDFPCFAEAEFITPWIESVSSSSTYSARHVPENAIDINPETQWATRGEGVGAWLKMTFTCPLLLHTLVFKDRTHAGEHNKLFELVYSDGSTAKVSLANTADLQEIELPSRKLTTSVTIKILEVYSTVNNGARILTFKGTKNQR